MDQKALHRLLESCRIEDLTSLEQDRLVVVLRVEQLLLEEPVLDGCQRSRSGHEPLFGFDPERTLCNLCELGDRLALEELPGRQTQPLTRCPGDDLDGEDRVATELEEVVMHAEPLDPQNLRPDLRQDPLLPSPGRDERLSVVG